MKNGWTPEVSVKGYWIPNLEKLTKDGKPTFSPRIVRKIILKTTGFAACFLVKRDTVSTKHMQVVLFRGNFNVSAVVNKDIPWYDRGNTIPTKNYTVQKCSHKDELVRWLAYYLKDENTAKIAVHQMLTNEPVFEKKAA